MFKNIPLLLIFLSLVASPCYSEEENNNYLPCQNSSPECIEKLTQQAIASSPKLKTINSRIALIDERLELMGDRKDYAESKLWTNYFPASSSGSSIIDIVNPFAWIKNLAGGGDMQRDRLANCLQQRLRSR